MNHRRAACPQSHCNPTWLSSGLCYAVTWKGRVELVKETVTRQNGRLHGWESGRGNGIWRGQYYYRCVQWYAASNQNRKSHGHTVWDERQGEFLGETPKRSSLTWMPFKSYFFTNFWNSGEILNLWSNNFLGNISNFIGVFKTQPNIKVGAFSENY